MPSTFWSNTIWYVLLGITIIIELILIFKKVKNTKLVLAIYITICGIDFAFQMTVASVLNGYKYFPRIIPSFIPQYPQQYDFNDSIMGNYFSQFSVSATALLIVIYNLNFFWNLAFAGTYCVIEELFLKLGIYKHIWYQTWMTFVVLPLLFWITKKIYRSCLDGNCSRNIEHFWRYIFISFGLITLHVSTITWFFQLLGIHFFYRSFSFTQAVIQKAVLTAQIYGLVLSTIIMVIYFSKIKWWWKSTVILILYIVHYIAVKLGFMTYKEGWFLPFTTISIFGMYLYTYVLDKLYGPRPSSEKKYFQK